MATQLTRIAMSSDLLGRLTIVSPLQCGERVILFWANMMPELPHKLSGLKIAESPLQDRPRERLLSIGAEKLRLAELFAILIRSGRKGESASQAGEKLAASYRDRLDRLPDAQQAELKETSFVVAKTAYCQIMAGVELGRRVADAKVANRPPRKIRGSDDAIAYCEEHFQRLIADASREEFHIVSLDTKNQVIDSHQISVGTPGCKPGTSA